MGFLSRIYGFEKRAVPGDAYLGAFLESRTVSGATVTPDSVLSAMAVATACVSRRSQGLASVPLCIHRNVGTSNAARAEDHPLYDVLNVRPNDHQSAF